MINSAVNVTSVVQQSESVIHIEFPFLYNRSFLAIYFIYSHPVYVSDSVTPL